MFYFFILLGYPISIHAILRLCPECIVILVHVCITYCTFALYLTFIHLSPFKLLVLLSPYSSLIVLLF